MLVWTVTGNSEISLVRRGKDLHVAKEGRNVLKRLTPSGGARGGGRSAPKWHFVKDKH